MEPAGLVLSIVSVVKIAAELVEVLHDFKDGGKQRIRLSAEVSSLWIVLENVKSQLDEFSASSSNVSTTYLATLGSPNGSLSQCSEILGLLLDKCSQKDGARRVLRVLRWPFDKDEVDRYLTSIHRLQTSINLAFAQTSLTLLSGIAADTNTSCEALQRQERQGLLSWLSPIDFEAQQTQTLSEWCPGTVTAFLQTPEYESFKAAECPFLWCPAGPGAGKSVFCSLVTKDLRTLSTNNENVAVLGVYISNRSASQGEIILREILGSLIKQLCLLGYGPDEELLISFRSATESARTLGADDLVRHLKRLLLQLTRTFVVIDAIDELQPHSRRVDLIDTIKELSPRLSVFIASRPLKELASLCTPLHHICDVCDGMASGFHHCSEHEQGGWDICPSCHTKGNLHCPDQSHPPPTFLPSTLTLFYAPLESDIRRYAENRTESDKHLYDLLSRKESLRLEVINKIVDESRQRLVIL
jgi:hypothetical protein